MTKKRKHSEYREKILEMRQGRIDKAYLLELVMDYKFKRSLDSEFPMPSELAEVVLVIIDKMLGSNSWRKYSDDWKEEFRGRAIEHVLKYTHNFDPVKNKVGKDGKPSKNDPYNYFAMIINNAFIQSWRKCKNYTETNVIINYDLMYQNNEWSDGQDSRPDTDSVTPDLNKLDWGHF